jgi:predicted permease
VITAHLAYPRWEDNPRGRLVKMRAIADRLEAIPGITAVGFANDLAFVDRGILMSFIIVDSVPGTLQPAEGSHWMMVSGGYFPALGIPIIQGRPFTMADDSAAPPVAIVDLSTARKYFPNGDALGHLISLGGNDPPATIVGVAADVLDEEPGRDSRIPQLYFPLAATPPASVSLVARGALTDRQLQSAVLTAVRSVDRTQPVYDIRMMQDVVHDSGAPRRTNMELMTLFAVLALALAAFGTYAVISQAAAQRQREFGIRAALGAQRGDLILLASHELAWVVAVGITVGLGVSWMAARAAATMLYHVAPHDLPTFAAVLAVLVTVALVATLAPAIRAARANPADVIRTE